jgi:hypothetical protein
MINDRKKNLSTHFATSRQEMDWPISTGLSLEVHLAIMNILLYQTNQKVLKQICLEQHNIETGKSNPKLLEAARTRTHTRILS